MTAPPKLASTPGGILLKTKTLKMSNAEWEKACALAARAVARKRFFSEDEDTGKIYFTHVSCSPGCHMRLQGPSGTVRQGSTASG